MHAATTIGVSLDPEGPGSVRAVLEGSMWGFGPIVNNYLRAQVRNLRSRIELAVAGGVTPAGRPAPSSVAGELEKLADLNARGVLTDEEFANVKARLIGG
jgi:hypothetical protein